MIPANFSNKENLKHFFSLLNSFGFFFNNFSKEEKKW